MDDNGFGLITWIFIGVGGLVVLLGGALGIAYAADAKLEATVEGKDCSLTDGSTVDVKTKILGFEATVEVDYQQCQIIQRGNFVEHRIRSEETIIYAKEGGECIWSTKTGAC